MKIGEFLCYLCCFFVCRALPNEKEALVRIVKKPWFLTGFFIVFLVDDRSESIENNRKDGCKSSQNRYLFDDTIFDSKTMKNRPNIYKKLMENRSKFDWKLIGRLKMAGRRLREALGRHFDRSWEASKGYATVQPKMVRGSGPPQKETKVSL